MPTPPPKKDPNKLHIEVKDPGLGFSPAQEQASMARSPSVRDKNRKDRKQAKRDIEQGLDT